MRTALIGFKIESIPLQILETSMHVMQEAISLHRTRYGSSFIPGFVEGSEELEQLVVDSCGNCRILELIFKSLKQNNMNITIPKDIIKYWDKVKSDLFGDLNKRYVIYNGPIAGAIVFGI
jgi:hypothetical protein